MFQLQLHFWATEQLKSQVLISHTQGVPTPLWRGAGWRERTSVAVLAVAGWLVGQQAFVWRMWAPQSAICALHAETTTRRTTNDGRRIASQTALEHTTVPGSDSLTGPLEPHTVVGLLKIIKK